MYPVVVSMRLLKQVKVAGNGSKNGNVPSKCGKKMAFAFKRFSALLPLSFSGIVKSSCG
ncbi:hypothetical protein L4D06_21525 [Enterovibrio makurazakiensis]|uniref:Uncharacterized protein n=1 Tax=Enterovibrio gelatinilyticus TaxID=2899819 RepID=A0ABT5QVX6_9GAMM|nr:hypothetical protein [Enterovibrio sp. ZSDZ42]MDD1792172.1 hypothetical protein [Enterovibrio sp. ZSDZ42]